MQGLGGTRIWPPGWDIVIPTLIAGLSQALILKRLEDPLGLMWRQLLLVLAVLVILSFAASYVFKVVKFGRNWLRWLCVALSIMSIFLLVFAGLRWWAHIPHPWNFEDGTPMGWGAYETGKVWPTQDVAAVTEYAKGKHSLRVSNIANPRDRGYTKLIAVQTQTDNTTEVSAWVYLPAHAAVRAEARFFVFDGSEVWRESREVQLVPGRWTRLVWDLRALGASWRRPWGNLLGIQLNVSDDFEGRIYLDSVTIKRTERR